MNPDNHDISFDVTKCDVSSEDSNCPSVYENTVCSFVSPADGFPCQHSVWPGSKKGFCIGHDPSPEKNSALFLSTIQKKFRNRDYNFDGFIFTYPLTIKNINTSEIVSFHGCRFHQGVRFENVCFTGPMITFEDCVFGGLVCYFHQCKFEGKKVSFANSVFDGDLAAFHRCRFEGERTDFSGIKWRARKRITFVHSIFNSQDHSFDSAYFESPIVAFRGGTIGSNTFRFNKTKILSDYFSLNDIHQLRGTFSLENSQLRCQHVDITQTDWKGDEFRFTKCNWQGQSFFFGTGNSLSTRFLMQHCKLEGERIDFSGLSCLDGAFNFEQNRLKSSEYINFSSVYSNRYFAIQKSRFHSGRVLFENVRAEGTDWIFQNNTVESNLFSCQDSQFLSKRNSWNRSEFLSELIDFNSCHFDNIQTSFQALKFHGKLANFARARFLSQRTSFQLSKFVVDQLNMEEVNFGSGNVSFWKVEMECGRFSLRNSFDENASILFTCDLSTALFEGSHLTHCDFTHAAWEYTGWLKRPRIADEKRMIDTRRYAELKRCYEWIASQYDRSDKPSMRDDFIYSSKDIERWMHAKKGTLFERIRWEASRWFNGYGMGFSRGALLKGLTSLFTFLIFYFAFRIR